MSLKILLKDSDKDLEKILCYDVGSKTMLTIGYCTEGLGICYAVLGMFTGNNYSIASGMTIAYFGVLMQRTGKFLKAGKDAESFKGIESNIYEDKLSKELMANILSSCKDGTSKSLDVIISLTEKPSYNTEKETVTQEEYDAMKQFSEKYQKPVIKEVENLGGKVTHQFVRANQLGATIPVGKILELVKSEYVKEIRLPEKLKAL